MNRLRILLADDHPSVSEELHRILELDYELMEDVRDGTQLIEAALRFQPDVIVADISMPYLNGLDAVEQLRRQGVTAKVIFLTMHSGAAYALRALQVGASGYLLKHSASEELVTAIEEVVAGRIYVTPSVTELIESVPACVPDSDIMLTRRQREVLQLVAEGLSARQVAKVLHISPRTVEGHKSQIMHLLGVRSTSELILYAIRHSLVKPAYVKHPG